MLTRTLALLSLFGLVASACASTAPPSSDARNPGGAGSPDDVRLVDAASVDVDAPRVEPDASADGPGVIVHLVPAELTIPRTHAGTSSLTLERLGVACDASVVISALVPGLTANSPQTIPTSNTTAILTISADSAAPVGGPHRATVTTTCSSLIVPQPLAIYVTDQP